MLALLIWIGGNSDYNANVPLPAVEYRSFEALYQMGYTKYASDKKLPKVWAIYDNSTVYLHNGFDMADIKDRSRLLHEMIHHLQVVENKLFRCDAAMEKEAYQVQERWLKDQGSAYFGPDEKELAMDYGCSGSRSENEEIERKYL